MYVKYFNTKSQLIVLMTSFLAATPIFANPVIPVPVQPQQVSYTPGAPNLQGTGYILMDATSGKVIAEKSSDERMPPASLTKLMSMYIISGAIKNGAVKLNDKAMISTKAWKTEGSRMFVKAGDEVPVKDLIQGIIVESGNDATVAMAEHVAGTEEAFTDMMNTQAKILGMNNSHFVDSTGLPNPDHYSTARDLAILTQAYINTFPEDYAYYSEKTFNYGGIKQPNRNRLLWRYQYADGLKTGHTTEAGYCLVASAKKDGMRLISVVLGEPSDAARTEDSMRLMNYGFRFYETHKVFSSSKPVVNARVWQGENTNTQLGIKQDMYVTIPTGQYKKMQTTVTMKNPLKAPLVQGESYGSINLVLNGQVVESLPLIALENNPVGSFWRRTSDSVKFNINKYFSKTEEKANTG